MPCDCHGDVPVPSLLHVQVVRSAVLRIQIVYIHIRACLRIMNDVLITGPYRCWLHTTSDCLVNGNLGEELKRMYAFGGGGSSLLRGL